MANNDNEAFAAADSTQSTVLSNDNDQDPGTRSPAPRRILTSGLRDALLGTPSSRPRQVRDAASGKVFTVWEMSKDVRECNDIIHNDIKIPPAVQVVLDTPAVQRLADLKQLGCSYHAYPNCTHCRKQHSLGVMEIVGRSATNIQETQDELEISGMDILCVRIAGLCHDLGHGPYSHCYEVFLKAAYKNEKDHPEQYEERNAMFKEQFGIDMPPLPEHYEHEKSSLMMVDYVLAELGLEIDWDALDEPLKQIGDGVDRMRFGLDLGKGKVQPFTSRDWIFIKECIFGWPLDTPDAPTAQEDFVGRGEEKEFLYDFVNNRHNGADLDKMDYFLRDEKNAFGGGSNWGIFLRDAFVAKGSCPNPETCFKCKNKASPGKHLMICYPMKHVSAAIKFFGTRMSNHEDIYTHKKTKGAELQMVDLLVEADKHFSLLHATGIECDFGLPVPSRYEAFQFKKLPLSRAWMYPELFLLADDSIVKIITSKVRDNPSPQLNRLVHLIKDRMRHRFYKRVAELEIYESGREFWEMTSEDDIKHEMLEQARYMHKGKELVLDKEDFIVEKRVLHYGRKDKNPVLQMRFLSKRNKHKIYNPAKDLPTAVEARNLLPSNVPQSFQRRTLRIFCRSYEKYELISQVFESWMSDKTEENLLPPIPEGDEEDDSEPESQLDSQPAILTQPEDYGTQSPRKRKGSEDSSGPQGRAKKRLF